MSVRIATSSSFCNSPRPASSRIACGSVLMPTPSSRMVSDCSNSSQPMPRARSINAVVRPPIPPPTIIAFIGSLHSNRYANVAITSHGPLLGRKRLCRFGFQLGASLWLSLNFQIVEILPVAHAVAEDLLLARQILRRAEHAIGAVPGGGLQGERRIDQMRPPQRDQVGAAGGEDGIDLV